MLRNHFELISIDRQMTGKLRTSASIRQLYSQRSVKCPSPLSPVHQVKGSRTNCCVIKVAMYQLFQSIITVFTCLNCSCIPTSAHSTHSDSGRRTMSPHQSLMEGDKKGAKAPSCVRDLSHSAIERNLNQPPIMEQERPRELFVFLLSPLSPSCSLLPSSLSLSLSHEF